MSVYEFIKKCKNYNIKKSKGWMYETVVKWAMNEIARIERRRRNYLRYIPAEINNWMQLLIPGKRINRKHYPYYMSPSYFVEYFGDLERRKDLQKFKMSVHYLKTKLPDALVLNIGSFL